MTAVGFTLVDLMDGRHLGAGLVCAAARYCSVLRFSETAIARRFLSPAAWLAVERQLAEQLETGPLPSDSAIAVALLGTPQPAVVVQYVAQLPVSFPRPEQVAAALDALLRALP